MKTLIVGIDPGPSWTGIARVAYEGGHWWGEAFVLDTKTRGLIDAARAIALMNRGATQIAIESFQQRAVGHQQFANAETPQLIGALRYALATDKRQTTLRDIAFVQPGDPDRELPELPIGRVMTAWTASWAAPRAPEWHHARSAWRILSRYLLSTQPDLFVKCADPRVLRTITTRRSEFRHAPCLIATDLIATTVTWGTPK